MIQEKDLEMIFYNAVDIASEGEDSVFLGTFLPTDAPAGIDAVTKFYTKYIDRLLEILPLGHIQCLQLHTLRCFTYNEHKALYDIRIKEKDFAAYPVFRALLITTEKERRLFTRSTDTHEAYSNLLSHCTKINNPFLYSFLYEVRIERTNF